jgi:hypothetical protein
MDVDRLAASTLAFCTICGLRLTVRFCFRVDGIRRGFLHWKIVLHVFYVHGRPSVGLVLVSVIVACYAIPSFRCSCSRVIPFVSG